MIPRRTVRDTLDESINQMIHRVHFHLFKTRR